MIKIDDRAFFRQNAFVVAHQLLGKLLVRKLNGNLIKLRITELEIYYGEEDRACHARFGKTKANEPLYQEGGTIYVYLCYGIHYLLNIVTGLKDHPEGIMIRAVEGHIGPGKLTKALEITKEFNNLDIINNNDIWIEDDGLEANYIVDKRIGIDYAKEPYKSIKWRYILVK